MKRLLSTVAVVAIACAGGTGAFFLGAKPRPAPQPVPAVAAPPAPLTLACGGELQRTVDVGVNVSNVNESISEHTWVVAAAASGTAPKVEIAGKGEVPRVGDIGFYSSGQGLAGVVRSETVTSGSLELAGATVHTASAGDLRGVAANPCRRARSDQWIVGSRSQVGVSNQLILTNPGSNPVTVKVEALTAAGKAELGGTGTVVVDSGQSKRVSIDGALRDQPRFALHVTTESGSVAASLQQTSLDGYTPAGVSFVTSSVAARNVTVPGVRIDGGGSAALRIANPNASPATVSVTALTDKGASTLPGGGKVTVEARSVLDLSLAGLPAGNVSFRIAGSADIVAGAEFTVKDGGQADNAWAAAGSARTAGSAVFGPTSATLVAVSKAGLPGSVTATPIDANGKDMPAVKADVNGQASLPMPEGAVAVRYTSTSPMYAGIASTAQVEGGKGVDWVPLGSSDVEETSKHVAVG